MKQSFLRSCIGVCMLLLHFAAFSQPTAVTPYNDVIAVLPPSPEAAQLGDFTKFRSSSANGTYGIDISLHTLKTGPETLPLSLQYTTGGLKADAGKTTFGLGWRFLAGGVITRTVFGAADENSTWIATPANFVYPDQANLAYFNTFNPVPLTQKDNQHDLFSFNFNGIAGTFILDESRNIQLLEHSNLKIEKDGTNASGYLQGFRVTDGFGNVYHFGGTGATEENKNTRTGCGNVRNFYVPTAWYLNRIDYASGKWVTFAYYIPNNGIGEKTSYNQTRTAPLNQDNGNSSVPHYTCDPPAFTASMKECITSLITRNCQLTTIQNSAGETITFDYNNDRLCSAMHIAQAGATRDVLFTYYTVTPNASFSNNWSQNEDRFFLKDVSFYSGTALQNKYSLEYTNLNNIPPRFTYAQDHWGYFNGKSNTSFIPPPDDPSYNSFFPNANADRSADASYAINGSLSKISYPTGGYETFEFEANTIYDPQADLNKTVGGLRIKKVRKFSLNGAETVKTFYYAAIDDLSKSSGNGTIYPQYTSISEQTVSNPNCQWTNVGVVCAYRSGDILTIASTPKRPLEIYNGYHVQYTQVIECDGNDFSNGALVHYYSLFPDQYPNAIGGTDVFSGVPLTRYLPNNGMEWKKVVYKNSATGLVKVRQTENEMRIDTNIYASYPSVAIARVKSAFCNQYGTTDYLNLPQIYKVNLFYHYKRWSYLKSKTETEFDDAGNVKTLATTTYTYANPANPEPTSVAVTASNQKAREVKYWYASDYTPAGTSFINDLKTNNVLSKPVKRMSYTDNLATTGEIITYTDKGLPLAYYKLQTAQPVTHTHSPSQVVQPGFNQELALEYGTDGNMQTAVTVNGIKNVYRWNSAHLLTAMVANTTAEQTVTTSFEESVNGLELDACNEYADAVTGRRCMNVLENGYMVTSSNLPAGSYTVSFWMKGATDPNISPRPAATSKTLMPNGWYLCTSQVTLTAPRPIRLSAASGNDLLVDEFRLAPADALVKTYTYDPLTGITSEMDPNHKAIYYEYDAFSRLKFIRNQDGKVLKKFCYNYAGQPENCN